MEDQIKVEAILALELFQLDPRSRQPRKRLCRYLLEAALLKHDDSATVEVIVQAVTDLVGGKPWVEESELQAAASECVKMASVDELGDGSYRLRNSDVRNWKINEMFPSAMNGTSLNC